MHSTSDVETIARQLGGSFVTARPGAFTAGKVYSRGQVGVVQRTRPGAPSQTLARFKYVGSGLWEPIAT